MDSIAATEDTELALGQTTPIHYHFQMLSDTAKTLSFKQAIEQVVPKGGKVLELGAGTGILSFFAAERAAKVYYVEQQASLAHLARAFLDSNAPGSDIEVIVADARQYVPPEPVDVVICDILHSSLLRDQQLAVLSAFKQNYRARFKDPLPIFLPEATILGVEPIFHNFDFHGFRAKVSKFQDPNFPFERTVLVGDVEPYHILEYSKEIPKIFEFDGQLNITETGVTNALRFVTKNILTLLEQESSTIDWFNQHLILPLAEGIEVQAGDVLQVRFRHSPGGEIEDLMDSIECFKVEGK